MQDIIWAFSRTPPESADADADISVHHLYGSSVLNLTRTAAGVSEEEPVPSPVPSAEAGEDEVDADVGETTGPARRRGGISGFVHAALCILAFFVVIPSGALVVRYAKATGSSAAFNLHRYLQIGVGECRVFGSRCPANILDSLPAHSVRFYHRDLGVGSLGCHLDLFPSSPLPAGTSIAGGLLAYLFMDSDGSGGAHQVSKVKKLSLDDDLAGSMHMSYSRCY
jgi:hypothetical protein